MSLSNISMPFGNDYLSSNRSKHYLEIHPIFVRKYRKPLLVGKLNEDAKIILRRIATKSDFDIEVMETDKDHIHFLIRYIPTLSVSSIVRCLKQESTVTLRKQHQTYLRKNFWKERTFWSDGFFACSTGEASPATVEEYIRSQG